MMEMKITRLFRRLIFVLVAISALLFSLHAHSAKIDRLALVIGNAAYAEQPLKNPLNDASVMARTLNELGFSVTAVFDMRRRDIGRTVEGFIGGITPGSTVVVFYAGHGMQIRGENYLPAIDASFGTEYDVTLDSINVSQLLTRIDEMRAGVKILLLDACRNNPYAIKTRSTATRGLARVGVGAPIGTLISFATRPGGVAEDGEGKNGLYTLGLLKHIREPNLPVELMFKRVASAVVKLSAGRQEPWIEGSIRGEFAFSELVGNGTSFANNGVKPQIQIADANAGPVAALTTGALQTETISPGIKPIREFASNPQSGWDVLLHEYAEKITIERIAKLPFGATGKPTDAQIAANATVFSCALQPADRNAKGSFQIAGACIGNRSKTTLQIAGSDNILKITSVEGGRQRHDLILLNKK